MRYACRPLVVMGACTVRGRGRSMHDAFSRVHPIVSFLFFMFVVTVSMVVLHPVVLALSLAGSTAYAVRLNGMRAVLFGLGAMAPMLLFCAVVNMLVNHAGTTVLFVLGSVPFTLEAFVYGFASGMVLASIITWFSCYNAAMTSDSFVYLFGRVAPALALLVSMVFRLVPRLKAQARQIMRAQRGIGRDVRSGGLFDRVRLALTVVSILTAWAFENSVDAADSMRARGFGLPGRTVYRSYRLTAHDAATGAVLLALALAVLAWVLGGGASISFFPHVVCAPLTLDGAAAAVAWGLMCFTPLIIDCLEDLAWDRLSLRG